VSKFLGRAMIVVFGNEIEVLGNNFVLLNENLERVLSGDCQNIGGRVIMAVTPVPRLL